MNRLLYFLVATSILILTAGGVVLNNSAKGNLTSISSSESQFSDFAKNQDALGLDATGNNIDKDNVFQIGLGTVTADKGPNTSSYLANSAINSNPFTTIPSYYWFDPTDWGNNGPLFQPTLDASNYLNSGFHSNSASPLGYSLSGFAFSERPYQNDSHLVDNDTTTNWLKSSYLSWQGLPNYFSPDGSLTPGDYNHNFFNTLFSTNVSLADKDAISATLNDGSVVKINKFINTVDNNSSASRPNWINLDNDSFFSGVQLGSATNTQTYALPFNNASFYDFVQSGNYYKSSYPSSNPPQTYDNEFNTRRPSLTINQAAKSPSPTTDFGAFLIRESNNENANLYDSLPSINPKIGTLALNSVSTSSYNDFDNIISTNLARCLTKNNAEAVLNVGAKILRSGEFFEANGSNDQQKHLIFKLNQDNNSLSQLGISISGSTMAAYENGANDYKVYFDIDPSKINDFITNLYNIEINRLNSCNNNVFIKSNIINDIRDDTNGLDLAKSGVNSTIVTDDNNIIFDKDNSNLSSKIDNLSTLAAKPEGKTLNNKLHAFYLPTNGTNSNFKDIANKMYLSVNSGVTLNNQDVFRYIGTGTAKQNVASLYNRINNNDQSAIQQEQFLVNSSSFYIEGGSKSLFNGTSENDASEGATTKSFLGSEWFGTDNEKIPNSSTISKVLSNYSTIYGFGLTKATNSSNPGIPFFRLNFGGNTHTTGGLDDWSTVVNAPSFTSIYLNGQQSPSYSTNSTATQLAIATSDFINGANALDWTTSTNSLLTKSFTYGPWDYMGSTFGQPVNLFNYTPMFFNTANSWSPSSVSLGLNQYVSIKNYQVKSFEDNGNSLSDAEKNILDILGFTFLALGAAFLFGSIGYWVYKKRSVAVLTK